MVPIVTQFFTLLSLLCVLSAVWPVYQFCRAFRHTALRSAAVWVVLVTAAWVFVSLVSVLEPAAGLWGWLGLLRLCACIILLAPIVAVLGARRPGDLVWNFIVATLLLVFSLPIFEQWVLGKELERGRYGMDGPRTTLYIVVALVGIVNYLPTRCGIAAILFGVGVALELAAVGPWTISADEAVWRHAASGFFFTLAAWSAVWLRRRSSARGIEGAWSRMRDGWGLIWSARVRDRWNAAARSHFWNLNLDWSGFRPVHPDQAITAESRDAAEQFFLVLLRRFFDAAK
jgi:hypothetical protein